MNLKLCLSIATFYPRPTHSCCPVVPVVAVRAIRSCGTGYANAPPLLPLVTDSVNEQSLQPQALVQRLATLVVALAIMVSLMVLSFYLIELSDPYIQDVLARQGNARQGEAIYAINCAGCHGSQAYGNVGPSLHKVSHHKSQVALIRQVISGKTPPMPKFQPEPQAMADLLSYLDTL